MKITIWDVLYALKKRKFLIIMFIAISMSAAYLYVKRSQSYTVQVALKYIDDKAELGLNPKGGNFDIYEIITPFIIESSIKDLGLKASVENVRSNISISPLIPDNIKELQKSKLDKGENYKYYPIEFTISYTVDSSKDGTYARNMLETILKNYYKGYGEKYLNQSTPPEVYKSINTMGYDYIEIAEVIRKNIDDYMAFLVEHNGEDTIFRSSKTGLNFTNLEQEYNTIKSVDVKLLFSYIYFGRLTLNKEELIRKYQYRVEQATKKSSEKDHQADTAMDILKQYSENNASKPSVNSNGEHSTNTSDVVRDDKFKSSQTTYDKVINNYVDTKVDSSKALTDAREYTNIINIYKSDTTSPEEKKQFTAKAKETIERIESKVKTLNELTDLTLVDFYNYNVSKHISSLSSVNISTNINLRLYMIISFILGAGSGIFFAIVIEIVKKLNRNKPVDNML